MGNFKHFIYLFIYLLMQTIIHHVAHKSINIVVDNEERRGWISDLRVTRPSFIPTNQPSIPHPYNKHMWPHMVSRAGQF